MAAVLALMALTRQHASRWLWSCSKKQVGHVLQALLVYDSSGVLHVQFLWMAATVRVAVWLLSCWSCCRSCTSRL